MSTTTLKYGFIKADISDAADITANNSNWDKLDTEINNLNINANNQDGLIEQLENTLSTHTSELSQIKTQVGTLQPKITYGTSAPSGGNNGDVYIQLI